MQQLQYHCILIVDFISGIIHDVFENPFTINDFCNIIYVCVQKKTNTFLGIFFIVMPGIGRNGKE